MYRLSKHSKRRIVERDISINYICEAKRLAVQAYQSGAVISEFQKYPKFFSYLQNKRNQTRTCSIRIYHNNIYIWRGRAKKTLVTVHPIPDRYMKEMEEIDSEMVTEV